MGRPSYDEIQRSLLALDACAKAWRVESDNIARRAPVYNGPVGSGVAAGVFVPVGLVYEEGCERLARAMSTAGARLGTVADTLRDVRAAYEADEERNVHAAQGMW